MHVRLQFSSRQKSGYSAANCSSTLLGNVLFLPGADLPPEHSASGGRVFRSCFRRGREGMSPNVASDLGRLLSWLALRYCRMRSELGSGR
jgi:hypothetical protein